MEFQTAWGGFVAWDLFLAGTGAGVYFISALAYYLGKKDEALTKTGVFIGAPLVAIGSLLLLADLGKPARFLLTFLRPQSSMMSAGVIIITVFIIVGFIHLAFLVIPGLKDRLTRRTEWSLRGIGMLFALAIAIYTGLLLGMAKAIPFWNTPILPILFLFSALLTGIGAVVLSSAIYRRVRGVVDEAEALESFHLLGRSGMVLISAELVILLILFIIMYSSREAALASASFLLTGGYALIFWIGVVSIGLLVPLALESLTESMSNRISFSAISSMGIISGICLMIGGLLLRYIILAAGVTVPPT